MKKFEPHRVCITQEEYQQLQQCKRIVSLIWRKFMWNGWPKEFRLPPGKTFADFVNDPDAMEFYQLRSTVDQLFDYDDSE